MNSLRKIEELGQSVWLDYIRRDLITSNKLRQLVEEDGLSGVTSNPTIFAKAISQGGEYDAAIRTILGQTPEMETPALLERIEVEDLRMAADTLAPIYERTGGADGFVSIEVSPHLAYDANASISEARRLWGEVNRPNLMVKIPATTEGLPAIEQLLGEGINVNVTLVFSVSQYESVVEAYLRGTERCPEPSRVSSVASFFVSRVDTAVDRALAEVGTEKALALRGRAAIANAKLVYRRFRQVFLGPQFEKWKSRGVRVQRPLWASTSTKNKAYSDVMYVEGLIGPDTITSMPPETLEAFRDHGQPQLALHADDGEVADIFGELIRMKINVRAIGQELTEAGVDKFVASYDELLETLEKKCALLSQTSAA
jgi:transaldolase